MQHGVRDGVNPNTANRPREDFWQSVSEFRTARAYPAGSKLFERGDAAEGIYLLEEGSVNLRWSAEGKAEPLFETAGPGAVLGLAESMTGEGYRLTAEVTEPSRVSFIERGAFLGSMQEHPEFCMQVVRLLSENLHGLYYRFQCTPQTRGKSSA